VSQPAKWESLAIQPNVYYTVEEAAQLLRISRQQVLQMLRFGQAQGVKIGRRWRILGAALLNLSAMDTETESRQIADWLAASAPALRAVWDDEEDAAYDKL